MPIDPEKYPEAKTFIYPMPRDFRYIFTCGSCNEGSLCLQHLTRTREQIDEVAKYNLRLQYGNKEFSNDDILKYIEEHKEELFASKPQKREDSSDESDSSSSSDEKSKKELKVENSAKEESKLRKNKLVETSSDAIQPPAKRQRYLRRGKTPSPKKPNEETENNHITNSNNDTPSTSSSATSSSVENVSNNKKRAMNGVHKDKKKDEDVDVFLYFEGEELPFGFVRISLNMTVQELREMILEEDVAKLKINDLFIYKKATIKIKQEHKLYINECILQDEKRQNMILIRKFNSGSR